MLQILSKYCEMLQLECSLSRGETVERKNGALGAEQCLNVVDFGA